MGDPVLLLSGLVGLEESMALSMRSNIESRKTDCGELGTDEGAKEDMVWKDCTDQRFVGVGGAGGGIVTEVCDRIVATADGGVGLTECDVGVRRLCELGSGVKMPGVTMLRFFFGRLCCWFLSFRVVSGFAAA